MGFGDAVMMFHKEKKICLLRPARVGSTSTAKFLGSCGWYYLNYVHSEPSWFVEKYPALNEYKFFCFIRNPLKRFVSSVKYVSRYAANVEKTFAELNERGLSKPVAEMTLDDYVAEFDKFQIRPLRVMFVKQSNYFTQPNTQALDFDNFETELRQLSGATDSIKYPLYTLNNSSDIDVGPVTDKVRAFVREYYAADYALAKDRLGKEYV